jgi:ribosomal-protein-alanine N-acetyltransferase
MELLRIKTARLELVLGTPDLFRRDLADRVALGVALGARVPESWPPPLMEDATLRHFIALTSDPAGPTMAGFYWVLIEDGERVLVGNGGLIREAPDRLALGYSVLDEYQRRGLATEAVSALVEFGFEDQGIDRIVAYTYPSFTASRRVLAKSGFVLVGAGSEPGTIAFERRR